MCHLFWTLLLHDPKYKTIQSVFYVDLVEPLFRNYCGRVMGNFDRRTDTGGVIAYSESLIKKKHKVYLGLKGSVLVSDMVSWSQGRD